MEGVIVVEKKEAPLGIKDKDIKYLEKMIRSNKIFFTKKASIYPIVGGIQGALFLIVGAVPTFVAILMYIILRSGAGMIFLTGERAMETITLMISTFLFGLMALGFLYSSVAQQFTYSSFGAIVCGLISVFMTPPTFPEVKTAGLLLLGSGFVTFVCLLIRDQEIRRILKTKVRIKQVDEETLKLLKIMENITSSAKFYEKIMNALYYICTGLGVLFVGSITVFSNMPVYSYVQSTSPPVWKLLSVSLAFTMPLALVFSLRKYLYWTGVAWFSVLAAFLVFRVISSGYLNILGLVIIAAAVAMPVLALMLSPLLKHQRFREKLVKIGELL